MDGRGFQPQFLSDTPGFHSDNMAARRRSKQARCMMGRDERERAVHCANQEGREGRTGAVPLSCVNATFGCVLINCWDVIQVIYRKSSFLFLFASFL